MPNIAALYSTNWLQLWALNSDLVNPDGQLLEVVKRVKRVVN
jgi:hypothetical protein